jgi:drug/metabolite transporter (DMT)-like permease
MIYILPALSAVVYAFAAILLKRAIDSGVGPWRTNYVVNTVGVPVFWLLLFAADRPFHPGVIAPAALAGGSFFVGQIFTFLALSRGDVSIATPVLGTKVIFVAFFTAQILRLPVPPAWWIAAFTTSIGIALLQSGSVTNRGHVLRTVFYSMLAALSFSLTDVLVQRDAPKFGAAWFIPVMFTFVALFGQTLILKFSAPLNAIPRPAFRVLIAGTLLLAIQALSMAVAIGLSGQATAVNIIYNSRGLWSICIIWLIGHHLGSTDTKHESHIMVRRTAGAILILAAIIIALLFRP